MERYVKECCSDGGKMSFFTLSRLMEIKEDQLKMEVIRCKTLHRVEKNLKEILKVLKGGVKDGKNKNKRNKRKG